MKRLILLFIVVALTFGVTSAVADNGIVEPWQMDLSGALAAEQVQHVELVVSFEGITSLGQADVSESVICATAQELRTLGNEPGEHPARIDQQNSVPLTDGTMSLNGRRGSYTQLLLMKNATFQEQAVTRSSTLNSMVILVRS